MENSGQQVIPKKRSKKKLIAIGVVIIIVIIIAAVVLSPKTTTYHIVNGGTVLSIPASGYQVYEFNTTSSGSIQVSVSATNGITFYLLTPSQYSSSFASGSGTPSSYEFTSGHISSGSFNTNIGSGTWYGVFYNSNIITTSALTINSFTFTT